MLASLLVLASATVPGADASPEEKLSVYESIQRHQLASACSGRPRLAEHPLLAAPACLLVRS
jgi:hypothetical protein